MMAEVIFRKVNFFCWRYCVTFVYYSRYGSLATDSLEVSGSELRRSMSDGNGSCGEDDSLIMEKHAEKEMS